MWSKNTSSFNNLLNSSKGRDKFCQLIQYAANLYVTCMRCSQDFGDLVKQRKVASVNRMKNLESQISNGRKIFRLLLFLNEIQEFDNIIKNSKLQLPLKILKLASTVCSFNYYLMDNLVWFSKMDFIAAQDPILGLKFKWLKNVFSFGKTVLEIIISLYNIVLKEREEIKLRIKLRKYNDKLIVPDAEWYVLARNLIIVRRECRFYMVEFWIYLLRFVLLTSSLRLVGHSVLHPIFSSLCGLVMSFCVVFKSMKGKKDFYKLTIEDLKNN